MKIVFSFVLFKALHNLNCLQTSFSHPILMNVESIIKLCYQYGNKLGDRMKSTFWLSIISTTR